MSVKIHPTALIEDGVSLGAGTSVWDHVHIRSGAVVGRDCNIGGKSYLANEVTLGDRVKVNSRVYLCSGVTVEDGVMLSAHVTFTNDRYPRATTPDLSELLPWEVDEKTERTLVRQGATVGAASVDWPGHHARSLLHDRNGIGGHSKRPGLHPGGRITGAPNRSRVSLRSPGRTDLR